MSKARVPLMLRARLRLAPRWLALRSRQSPRAVLALGLALAAVGFIVAANLMPASETGCRWQTSVRPGIRASSHLVCPVEPPGQPYPAYQPQYGP